MSRASGIRLWQERWIEDPAHLKYAAHPRSDPPPLSALRSETVVLCHVSVGG